MSRLVVRASLVTCALAVIAGAFDLAAAAYQIPRSVVGNGGTPAIGISGSGRVLRGTAGQAAVGMSSGPARQLHNGYWATPDVSQVGVDDPPMVGDETPKALALRGPRPNPAHRSVWFDLELPRASRVELTLMDLQGRRVRTLLDATFESGRHEAFWDGRDDDGRPIGPGIYFAHARVDGKALTTRRLLLLR